MTERPRCVVDTNVLISAGISSLGKPAQVLKWVMENGVVLASDQTLYEFVSRFLGRAKFDRYTSPEDRAAFYYTVTQRVSLIEAVSDIEDVARDPDDDKFLALALDGQADYIITGNTRDFPDEFEGVKVVTPREFATLYGI